MITLRDYRSISTENIPVMQITAIDANKYVLLYSPASLVTLTRNGISIPFMQLWDLYDEDDNEIGVIIHCADVSKTVSERHITLYHKTASSESQTEPVHVRDRYSVLSTSTGVVTFLINDYDGELYR